MIWQQKHLFAAALAGLLMAAPVVLPARQPAAKAALDLETTYDFCGPADARTILVNLWGNPAEIADGVLGMVMLRSTAVRATPISVPRRISRPNMGSAGWPRRGRVSSLPESWAFSRLPANSFAAFSSRS